MDLFKRLRNVYGLPFQDLKNKAGDLGLVEK